MAGFDWIARFYDTGVTALFGSRLAYIEACLVDHLPQEGHVLILGGGSGNVLNYLARHRPKLRVTYVDQSEKMLALARNQALGALAVTFVQADAQNLPDFPNSFDAVFTPFFLDLFLPEEVASLTQEIQLLLNKKAYWLYADFCYVSGWKYPFSVLFIQSMYLFFRITSGISGKRLSDVDALLAQAGFQPQARITRYGGMIEGVVWEKGVK